jgi:transcriptional/translational regulatory protein YebC/TACO1
MNRNNLFNLIKEKKSFLCVGLDSDITKLPKHLLDSEDPIFEFNKPAGMELEELELELIDAGLEEIEEEEGLVLAYADYKDFGNMNQKFEELGIELTKAELKRIPNNPQEFTEAQQEDIGKLIEKLEDDDDVQAVYTNIA